MGRWVLVISVVVLPLLADLGFAESVPVTVANAITMTEFGGWTYFVGGDARNGVAQFSPDGSKFVIVVKKGNLHTNTNVYSLLLFLTAEALRSPSRTILATLSSSSNRPGIEAVQWLDNRSIAFLGERQGGLHQLFTIDCEKRQLKQLTSHSTNLSTYAIGVRPRVVVFTAEDSVQPIVSGKSKRVGLAVTTEILSDLVAGKNSFVAGDVRRLFVRQNESSHAVSIETRGTIVFSDLWLSPNGRYLILGTMSHKTAPSWAEYHDSEVQLALRMRHFSGEGSGIFQYELVDLQTRESHFLIDAPLRGIGASSQVLWSKDSRSVIVSGAFLPLVGVRGDAEYKQRQSSTFVAEVKIETGEVRPISAQVATMLRWDSETSNLLLVSPASSVTDRLAAFQRTATGWKGVERVTSNLTANEHIEITLEEDPNTIPRIVATQAKTGVRSVLFDLNPQFEDLTFGHVESVEFTATDGHTVKAGVYLPPGYEPRYKCPLVIQTHGWNPKRFWINGKYSTAFAAQPLAAHGIVVMQLDDEDLTRLGTPAEAPEEAAAYEGAIDYLDGRGLIDRHRVGIIGFSRTGIGVEYALTHSKYRFAAATLADISDAGYFRYLAFLNYPGWLTADSEGINGGAPFGSGLAMWTRTSPGFNLDKVAAPVRMEAHGPTSLFFEWEWFTGLTRLSKPVELIYMPEAAHVLVKPWERMISQQGTVDWFRFWLKDEEDLDPEKADQYARWRELRKLEGASGKPDDSNR